MGLVLSADSPLLLGVTEHIFKEQGWFLYRRSALNAELMIIMTITARTVVRKHQLHDGFTSMAVVCSSVARGQKRLKNEVNMEVNLSCAPISSHGLPNKQEHLVSAANCLLRDNFTGSEL